MAKFDDQDPEEQDEELAESAQDEESADAEEPAQDEITTPAAKAGRSALVDELSIYETQADLAVRAKDQAADAKSAADSSITKLITLAAGCGIPSVVQIAKNIRESDSQIQDLVDNPGGVTELTALEKEAQSAFFAAAEQGDARVQMAAWRAATKETTTKKAEVRNLNKIRNGHLKNLLSAVKSLY